MDSAFTSNQHPNLPAPLKKYLETFVQRNPQSIFAGEFGTEESAANQIKLLDELIGRVALILGKPASSIPKLLGLRFKDFDSAKVDSFIAELKACDFLHSLGFVDVEKIEGTSTRSDFTASGSNTKWAVEVQCLITETFFKPFPFMLPRYEEMGMRMGEFDREEFINAVQRRIQGKKLQIDATMSSLACPKSIIIIVLASEPARFFNDHDRIQDSLKAISGLLNWGAPYHFAIITHELTWNIPDNCIYPIPSPSSDANTKRMS
jgi:hypothetical protein